MENFNISKSRRGGDVIEYAGHEYVKKRAPKSDGRQVWRCRCYNKYKCPSHMTTWLNGIAQEPTAHDHAGDYVLAEGRAKIKKEATILGLEDGTCNIVGGNSQPKLDTSMVGGMGGSEAGSTHDSLGDSAMDERPMPLSPEQFLTEEEDHPGIPSQPEPAPIPKRPESYKLRHNNHLSLVFESLAGDEAFMDVTLTAQGRSIKAHKSVLSAVSPYFNEVLRNNPCQHPIIIMPRDVRFDELNNIIKYIYRGEMTVPAEDLSSLLKTAEVLKVTGLSPSDGNVTGFITNNLLEQTKSDVTNQSTSSVPHFNLSDVNQSQYATPSYENLKKNVSTHIETSINPAEFVNADLSCVKEELHSDDEGMDEMIPNDSALDPLSLSSQTNSPHHSHQSASHSASHSSNEDISRAGISSINSSHLNSDGLQKMKIPPSAGESLSTPPLGTPPLATPPLGTPPSESSISSPLSLQPWHCPHCEPSLKIRGYDNLSMHLRLKHQSKASFLCECGRVFLKQVDKLEHKKSCTEG